MYLPHTFFFPSEPRALLFFSNLENVYSIFDLGNDAVSRYYSTHMLDDADDD